VCFCVILAGLLRGNGDGGRQRAGLAGRWHSHRLQVGSSYKCDVILTLFDQVRATRPVLSCIFSYLGTGLWTCPCIENSIVNVETFKHYMMFAIERIILNFVFRFIPPLLTKV
jgi:hypothetical protein